MTAQYVQCQFNPWDRRAYTYQNDGEPVAVGDKVVVENSRGDMTVTVVGICDKAPAFQCKPILRKAEAGDQEGDAS